MQLPLIGKKAENKFTPWLIGLVTAGLLGSGAVGVIAIRNATPKVNIKEMTVPVEAKDLTVRIASSGIVQPMQRVNLSPKNAGRIAELLVEQGDRVKAGQIIARMESRDIEAQIEQAKARLNSAKARLIKAETGTRPEEIDQAKARLDRAKANLQQLKTGNRPEEIAEARASVTRVEAQVNEARSRLNLALNNLKRQENLAAVGAISKQDLDRSRDEATRAQASIEQLQAAVAEAKRRLEKVENGTRSEEISKGAADLAETQSKLEQLENGSRPEEITQAKADVAEAEAQLRYYEVQLEDTKVRAPFDGIITQRYAIQGAFVTPVTSASTADSATSASIVALAKDLEVLAKVPEADIGQIKPGQEVEIVADSYPDQIFKGRVRLIAPEAIKERDVTLFQIRIEITTGKDKLQSGMNVDLKFIGSKLDDALVVPSVAIVTNKGKTGVLIPDEKNQPKFQPVTIGSTIDNQIQILEGVKSGDKVFVELPQGKKLEDIFKNNK